MRLGPEASPCSWLAEFKGKTVGIAPYSRRAYLLAKVIFRVIVQVTEINEFKSQRKRGGLKKVNLLPLTFILLCVLKTVIGQLRRGFRLRVSPTEQ